MTCTFNSTASHRQCAVEEADREEDFVWHPS